MDTPSGDAARDAGPGNEAPIFIVGFNGSGTTMLSECLGRHREIYSFPDESRLIPFFLQRGAGPADLADDAHFLRLWHKILQEVPAFRRVNGGRLPQVPADWRSAERSAAGIFDLTFRTFAAREHKRRWCEKSPQNLQHIERIAAAFPNAKFVHIIRDGRDCAASLHRRWRRTPDLTLYRWFRTVEDARSQGARLRDRYYEIRYEDLTNQPRRWLEDVLDFLGLPFCEEVLVSSHPQSQREGELGRIEANSQNWRAYFPPETLERLDRIAGPFLSEMGYPRLLDGAECVTPRRRDLIVWRLTDFLRALLIQRRRRKTRNRPGYGSASLWSDLTVSIRSFRSNRL